MTQEFVFYRQEVSDDLFMRMSNDKSFHLANVCIELYERRYRGEEKYEFVLDVSLFVPDALDRDADDLGFRETFDNWDQCRAMFPDMDSIIKRAIASGIMRRGFSASDQCKLMVSVIEGHRGLYEYDPENPPVIDLDFSLDYDDEEYPEDDEPSFEEGEEDRG